MENETYWLLQAKDREIEYLWQAISDLKREFLVSCASVLPKTPNSVAKQIEGCNTREVSTQTSPVDIYVDRKRSKKKK
jgi:hypothetical protein